MCIRRKDESRQLYLKHRRPNSNLRRYLSQLCMNASFEKSWLDVPSRGFSVNWTHWNPGRVTWIKQGKEWWVNSSLPPQVDPQILSWKYFQQERRPFVPSLGTKVTGRWTLRFLPRITLPWGHRWRAQLPGREGDNLRTVASALTVSLQVSKPTVSVWGSYLTEIKIKYMKKIYILSRKKTVVYICVSVYPINTFNLHLYAHIQNFFPTKIVSHHVLFCNLPFSLNYLFLQIFPWWCHVSQGMNILQFI